MPSTLNILAVNLKIARPQPYSRWLITSAIKMCHSLKGIYAILYVSAKRPYSGGYDSIDHYSEDRLHEIVLLSTQKSSLLPIPMMLLVLYLNLA